MSGMLAARQGTVVQCRMG